MNSEGCKILYKHTVLSASRPCARFQVSGNQTTMYHKCKQEWHYKSLSQKPLCKWDRTHRASHWASHFIVICTSWRTEQRGISRSSAKGNDTSCTWGATGPCTSASWGLTGWKAEKDLGVSVYNKQIMHLHGKAVQQHPGLIRRSIVSRSKEASALVTHTWSTVSSYGFLSAGEIRKYWRESNKRA